MTTTTRTTDTSFLDNHPDVTCDNRFLCRKPSGEWVCKLLISKKDYTACPNYNQWNAFEINPADVTCNPEHSRGCLYCGKREKCRTYDGSLTCGLIDSEDRRILQEFGSPPADLQARINTAIDAAKAQRWREQEAERIRLEEARKAHEGR